MEKFALVMSVLSTMTIHALAQNWATTGYYQNFTNNTAPLRLSNGGSSYGLVEIYINWQWGSICGHGFSNSDANVVCRQLGYSGSNTHETNGRYSRRYGPIWMTHLNCRGYEDNILRCSHDVLKDWTGHCSHNEDVSVSCYGSSTTEIPTPEVTIGRSPCDSNPCLNNGTCHWNSRDYWWQYRCTCPPYTSGQRCEWEWDNGRVRLRGGDRYSYGRVELYYNGQWGTICADGFRSSNARVVCRQIRGYVSSTTWSSGGYGTGRIHNQLSRVQCSGSESSIFDCPTNGYTRYCGHDGDVVVDCDGYGRGGMRTTAYPEVSTVSSCTSDPCRNNGTCHPHRAYHGGYYCNCLRYTTGQNCETDHRVRLAGGDGYSYGRVEVYYNGQWGTVCDDYFDRNNARVICTQLDHYNRFHRFTPSWTSDGYGTGIIWRQFQCSGYESSLFNCQYGGYGGCRHREDVVVDCQGWGRRLATAYPVEVTTWSWSACSSSPCRNGGTCVPDGAWGGYRCHCPYYYSGHDCRYWSATTRGYEREIDVHCTSEQLEVSIDLRSQPDLDPAYLTLADPNCKPTDRIGSRIIFRFGLTECWTTREERYSHMVYKNVVISRKGTSPYAIITRHHHAKMAFECRLNRIQQVVAAFTPYDSNSNSGTVTAYGNFTVDMDYYQDSRFRIPISNFPMFISLGQTMYIDLKLESSDLDLKIVVQECVATPNVNYRGNGPVYQIIRNKCAADPTTSFLSSRNTEVRFRMQSFEFIGTHPEVWIHCDVRVCNGTDNSYECDRGCHGFRGKRSPETGMKTYRLSKGPIVLKGSKHESDYAALLGRKESESRVQDQKPSNVLPAAVLVVCGGILVVLAVAVFVVRRKRKPVDDGYRPLFTTEDL